MMFQCLILVALGLQFQLAFSVAVKGEAALATQHDGTEDHFSPSAFVDLMPRPDLFSIPCFACLMEECPEVRRYPANTTIWTKCNVAGTLSPGFGE